MTAQKPTDIAQGKLKGFQGLGFSARPLSILYSVWIRLRRTLYDLGILKIRPTPVFTVSVGGLEVGGVGKTPVVVYILKQLIRHGRRPGRGAGGVRSLSVAFHIGRRECLIGNPVGGDIQFMAQDLEDGGASPLEVLHAGPGGQDDSIIDLGLEDLENLERLSISVEELHAPRQVVGLGDMEPDAAIAGAGSWVGVDDPRRCIFGDQHRARAGRAGYFQVLKSKI